jgi:hypothetical protein
MAYLQTIFPGYVPDGFFDERNVNFVRDKIIEVLRREYVQEIIVDHASIVRIMQRVVGERLEPVPSMNQRVIMYICNEYRNHQGQLLKHLNWEEHYINSQKLYDSSVESTFDTQTVKLANRLGFPRVGGTVRFMFI